MGESISRKLTQEAGLKGLADWLAAQVQAALVIQIAPTLSAVQEMRPFQRKIRISNDVITTIPIGERARHSITVPAEEAWLIHWISIDHTDSTGLDYEVRVERASPNTERIRLSHVAVVENTEASIYPARQITIAVNNNDFSHTQKLVRPALRNRGRWSRCDRSKSSGSARLLLRVL